MTALREVLASFGFDVDSKALVGANAAVEGLIGGITKLNGLAAAGLGALGLGALKGQVDGLAEESAELAKAATKSGLSLQEFQKLSYTSGLSTEKLTATFRRFGQSLAAAQGKSEDAAGGLDELGGGLEKILSKKEAGNIFKSLGLEATEDIGENFDAVIGKLAEMPNKVDRNALAMKLFGRAGQDLIPFLEKSPAELQRLAEDFDAFGGVTDEQRAALKKYQVETKAFDLAMKSVQRTLVGLVVPAFTAVFRAAVEYAKKISIAVDTSQLLTVGLGILATAFLVLKANAIAAGLRTAAAWALAALPFIALALILDDLVHFIKGDATTGIGQLYDLIFGKGSGETIAAQMRKDLDKLDKRSDELGGGLAGKINAYVEGIVKGIASVFTDTIPDAWNEFWTQMSIGLLGGDESFREFVSDAFSYLGAEAAYALLSSLTEVLGERISGALGLSKYTDEMGTYVQAWRDQINTLKADRQANFDINTRGGVVTGGAQALNTNVPASLPGSLTSGGPQQIDNRANVSQTNNQTFNIQGGDPAEVQSAVNDANQQNLFATVSALEARAVPKK